MTKVAFGMQLPIQALSTRMVQPWELECGPADLARVAQTCDDNGWDFITVCDHVAIPADRAEAMSTVWFDTVATLGWLAGITKRITLGSTVLVLPYRHPLVVAKSFTTLDHISGGRIILGIGAGHVEGEFDALGVPFKDRGRLTDEYIPVIKAAFADEFGVPGMGVAPRPVRPGGPPIWVGGSTKPALRRAARLGDGWLPQGPPEQGMAQAIADVHRMREEAGRAGGPFDIVGGLGGVYVGQPTWDVPSYAATGSPDKIAEQIRGMVAMGVTHVQPRPFARSVAEYCDQIEAFGREVAPLVRG